MKKNFDRRNLLKGLLTLPGAAALGGWMSSCNNENKSKPGSRAALGGSPTTVDFRIVLHGTYALQFDTQAKNVQLLLPEVFDPNGKEAHQYLAGFFRNETAIQTPSPSIVFDFPADDNNPLPPVLTKNPPASEDPTKFVILREQNLKQDSNGPLRNKFQLPYPETLRVLRAQELIHPDQNKFFENTSLIPKLPVQVPLCIALQYTLNVDSQLPIPSLHYHIFAEPNKKPGEKHIRTAFKALTALYMDVGGLKMSDDILNDIDQDPSKVVQDVDGISLPPNFDGVEPKSLEQRAALGGSFGAVHVGSCAGIILVSGPDA